MANLNKVLLVGNLTKKPELRYTPNGTAVTDLALAANRKFKSANGQLKEETTYVDISVFAKQAETCSQYLDQGRSVFVEGCLKLDQWDDKDTGEKKRKLKVVAEHVQFLDNKSNGRKVPVTVPAEPGNADLPPDDDVPF